MNLVLTLSLVLVTVPASAIGAAASGAVGEEVAPVERVERVDVEVDHSALLEHQVADAAEDSAYFVLEDATKALAERYGVQVVDDPQAPKIVVRLGWKDYEDSIYWIAIATQRPGREPEIVESFEAKCIDSTALSEAVVGRLPGVLERLGEEEPAPDAVVTEPGGEPVDEPRNPPEVQLHDDGEARVVLGVKGKVGIGLLVAGTVGVVTGGIVFAQQRRFDEGGSAEADWPGVDFRMPGVGVMAAGGVVAVTGAVLLILDRAQARRARRVARANVWLTPTTRGFAITGRF